MDLILIMVITVVIIVSLLWNDMWRVHVVDRSIDNRGTMEGFESGPGILPGRSKWREAIYASDKEGFDTILNSDIMSASPHYRYRAYLSLLGSGTNVGYIPIMMLDTDHNGKSLRQLLDIQDNDELLDRYIQSLRLVDGRFSYTCCDELAQRLGIPNIWIGNGYIMRGDSISGLRYLFHSRDAVDRFRALYLLMNTYDGMKPDIAHLLLMTAPNPEERGSMAEILIKISTPELADRMIISMKENPGIL